MMPGGDLSDRPRADEIRAARDRIVASPNFRASPQLAAFLRFVVEAALSGRSDRIKGYTIAVEALGRDADFDPQADPIVRVEAGRLRRAIERYYANGGANDPIAIELPRGSYVPLFRYRASSRAAWKPVRLARRLAGMLSERGRQRVAGACLVLFGAAAYCALDLLLVDPALQIGNKATLPTATHVGAPVEQRPLYVGPVIYVEPVVTVGTPVAPTISATSLRERLRDAFARFDEITVVSELAALAGSDAGKTSGAQKTAPADYRFASTAEYHTDGALSLTFRLLDSTDGTIVWSKSYDHLSVGDNPRATKYPIVNEIAKALLQPSGVLHARERIKQAAASNGDSRYRCFLEAIDYLRSFDPRLHVGVRGCLEQAIARDPSFVNGYVVLARVYQREYQFGADNQSALDRAFALAMRAVELRPNSARVQLLLMDLNAARGDLTAARAAGEKSIALNPNDAVVVFHYASHLIVTGEIERGSAILRQIAAESPVRPTRFEFSQFLAAYLTGDVAAASYHAAQMTTPTFTLGHLARTLAAVRADNLAAAQQSAERLVALQPAWKSDPRGQLRKFFPTPKIVDQIAADLAQAGIGAAHNADVSAAKANPRTNAANSAAARSENRLRSGSGMPTIYIEPFATTGMPTPVNTDMLRNEVADALGRFDDVEVVSEESRGPIDFRLTATLQFRNNHTASLTYRLLESGDASVIWSRTFDDFAFGEDSGAARKPALRELATTLAQPTGAIHSRARERRSTMEDRRYRCFLKAVEFWHNFESGARARARTCFEEMTVIDPNFAVGFSSLALIYLVEHRINLGAGSADRQGLERAARAAQRAVEVKPKSAMAQAALMEVLLARHEIAAGHEAGVKAIAINPFDIDNLAVFGAQLLGMGDIDTGAALLREASDSDLARPPTIEFCLFLGGYLTGDWTTATRHADRITIDTFPPGLIARALTAAANGDRERSAAAIARLIEINSDWGTTPRRMLANLFVSPLIVDWLVRGLAEAGLRDLTGNTADNAARP